MNLKTYNNLHSYLVQIYHNIDRDINLDEPFEENSISSALDVSRLINRNLQMRPYTATDSLLEDHYE